MIKLVEDYSWGCVGASKFHGIIVIILNNNDLILLEVVLN
jgi:hypothetical protein